MHSSILQQPRAANFDANNAEHRKAYVTFMNTGKWPVRFELEFPFTSLPSMVMFKLSLQACLAEGAVDTTALAKSAYLLTTEKAVAVNDKDVEKAA